MCISTTSNIHGRTRNSYSSIPRDLFYDWHDSRTKPIKATGRRVFEGDIYFLSAGNVMPICSNLNEFRERGRRRLIRKRKVAPGKPRIPL